MVDELRVLRLLRALDDDLGYLTSEAAADQARRRDPAWLRAVKYTFVTAIEAVVDVAQHMAAAEGWGPPDSNADAVRLLGRRGVLDPELGERLARAVGFRNVLVHEYVDVDDRVVVDRLQDLGDLRAFPSAVVRWLA